MYTILPVPVPLPVPVLAQVLRLLRVLQQLQVLPAPVLAQMLQSLQSPQVLQVLPRLQVSPPLPSPVLALIECSQPM